MADTATKPSSNRRRAGLIVVLSFMLLVIMAVVVVLSGLVINPFAARTVVVPVATATPTATLVPTATPFVPQQPPPAIMAQAAIMIDPATNDVLYSLHATDQRAMASTTKIMTALVTILTTTSLDQQVTVQSDIDALKGTGGSPMCCPTLQIGERFTLRDLLYGLLLPSGDDAAIVLADGVAGSQAAFVARMNQVAAYLGLTHTHFVNPSGLDTDGVIADGNYTTASELATLAQFTMRFPVFREIVATGKYIIPATTTHPQITLANTNEFLSSTYSRSGENFLADGAQLGVDGVKTGFTGNAGYCLVVDAQHGGHDVLLVVLDEPNQDTLFGQRFVDSAALLRWIFAQEPAA